MLTADKAISRRTFVSGAAITTTTAAIAGLPVPTTAVVAMPPAPAENPQLIAAGRSWERALLAFQAAAAHKQSVRARCEQLRPAVPKLLDPDHGGYARLFRHWSEEQRDAEGRHLEVRHWTGNDGREYCAPPPSVLTATRLRRFVSEHDGRRHPARAAKQLLKIAEQFEAECEQARRVSGLGEALEALELAESDLFRAAADVYEQPAATLSGVVIKARVMASHQANALRAEGPFRGVALAAELVRVAEKSVIA